MEKFIDVDGARIWTIAEGAGPLGAAHYIWLTHADGLRIALKKAANRMI